MTATGGYAEDVAARVRDFVSPHSHWQRRLWNVGLALELREILEATEAASAGVLSPEALSWLTERTRRRVVKDPGAGNRDERTFLTDNLKKDLSPGGVSYLSLAAAAAEIDTEYLRRWATELRREGDRPGRERTARALAAHLLDVGIGRSTLTAWLDEHLRAAGGDLDIAVLFEDAQALVDQPLRRHTVLVPFVVAPPVGATLPREWVNSEVAAGFLREHFPDVRLSQRGGLLLEIEARDEEGALSAVADTIDRFSARVVVGTDGSFDVHDQVYVAGGGKSSRSRPRRSVEVHALKRADRVYDLKEVGSIDSALELLAHLETAAPPVAVAAGWSAIESILVGPGTRPNVTAADRLANLVACSWPRAELTDLAWAKARQKDDELCSRLFRQTTNRDKARCMAAELRAGKQVLFNDPSDVAAARRMAKLVANPRSVLGDVRDHATECFRRLYRVRNLILHGGEVAPIALGATLRTAPPLVGAGMDRVAHAYLVGGRTPLELAAKAELELARAGAASAPPLTDVLE